MGVIKVLAVVSGGCLAGYGLGYGLLSLVSPNPEKLKEILPKPTRIIYPIQTTENKLLIDSRHIDQPRPNIPKT